MCEILDVLPEHLPIVCLNIVEELDKVTDYITVKEPQPKKYSIAEKDAQNPLIPPALSTNTQNDSPSLTLSTCQDSEAVISGEGILNTKKIHALRMNSVGKAELLRKAVLEVLLGKNGETYEDLVLWIADLKGTDKKLFLDFVKHVVPKPADVPDHKLETTKAPILISIVNRAGDSSPVSGQETIDAQSIKVG